GTQNYGLWYEDAAHALSIWTHTQQRLTVSDDGDVGIGVTPTAKLDVAGKIKANNGTNAALNLPILTSDPASPVVGDVWIRNTSGTYSLKVRVNSTTTKSVTLS
ncbi:MAG: hypothetical protein JW913_04870, partial [Chitinispirillaceae bacterium]|nr:hypothetical protein [Chitinispirillaceae bacterium]